MVQRTWKMIQRGRAQQHGCEVDFCEQFPNLPVFALALGACAGLGSVSALYLAPETVERRRRFSVQNREFEIASRRFASRRVASCRVASRRVVSRRDHIASLVLVRLDVQNRSFLFSKPNKNVSKTQANDQKKPSENQPK